METEYVAGLKLSEVNDLPWSLCHVLRSFRFWFSNAHPI